MRKLLVTTALLTAAATASAATWEVTLDSHLIGRAGNTPSASLINPAPAFVGDSGNIPLPTCTYNDATNVLDCTGVLHLRSQTNPTINGRVFDRYITDLNIDATAGDPSGTAGFICENFPEAGSPDEGSSPAGGFGGVVGASICGNYTLGGNFVDDSTMTYGPGLAFSRTIGGDDVISGDPQNIANYEMTEASFTPGPGGTLVIQSADWDAVSSTGTQMNFTVGDEAAGPPTVNDDAAGVLEDSSNNVINVLANDTNLPANVLVVIDDSGLAAGSTATVQVDNTILYSPDPALVLSNQETIPYDVQDTDNGNAVVGSATLTITIEEDLLPVAPDGAISISSLGGATTAGSVNVSGLVGYSAGNAPGVVAIDVNADGGTEGTCAVNGTTISFTRVAAFVNGADTATCTYTVTDSDGDVSEPGTITITINDVQPAVNGGSASGEVDGGDLVATGSFTAGNGSVAQHTLEVTTGDCTVDVNGGNVEVTYADDTVAGDFSCTVTLTDADGDADTADFTFEVTEPVVDDRPRLPGGGGAMDLWSLMLLGGLPLLGLRRRRS